jgi:2-C-methyl-D-erythritol 2,4-cyclodiphosphate synthase
MVLLKVVHQMVSAQSWQIVNIDTSIIAEQPKLKPHLLAIRESLSTALNLPVERVSVKARTNEGLDAVGRGEAIATHAVVLLTPLTN